MKKERVETFSDAMFAIIMTVMVLELHAPQKDTWGSLAAVGPVFVSYVLSFTYVGIYWVNHHHMLQAVRSVSGGVLWGNVHLLFWLSLLPFTTEWIGQTRFTRVPMVLYGINLVACSVAYTLLQMRLVLLHGKESPFAVALGKNGNDMKGKLSLALDIIGICLAWFVAPILGLAIFIFVALMWLVPDPRMAAVVAAAHEARDD